MKHLIYILFTAIFLCSCEKDDSNEKCCWKFSTKSVTSISPSVSGYPKIVTSETTQCNLTEAEADEIIEKLSTTAKSSSGGYTVTIKTTVTKKKTTDKPITGERVPIGS